MQQSMEDRRVLIQKTCKCNVRKNSTAGLYICDTVSYNQFHEFAKNKNLLSIKMSCLVKPGYRPKVHVSFMLWKQQLKTSYKQNTSHENLVGYPVFIKEEFS